MALARGREKKEKKKGGPRLEQTDGTACPPHNLCLLPLAEHTLHNLLLLKKEGAEDALTDALGAARATVRTGDVLLALGEAVQHGRAHTRDAGERAAAVAAAHGLRGLADVLEGELAAGDADRLALVAAGLVRAAATVGETLDHGELTNKKIKTHKNRQEKKKKEKTKKKKGAKKEIKETCGIKENKNQEK